MTGEPVGPGWCARFWNGSPRSRSAKRTAHSSCSSARTFTQNFPASAIMGWLRARRFTQTSTIGGSSETLANALAVNPLGLPSSPSVVTIVTPVGKRRMTARKPSVVIGAVGLLVVVETGADAGAVAEGNDRCLKLRVVQEELGEGAECFGLSGVGFLRIRGDASAPQQVVDDDEPRALE